MQDYEEIEVSSWERKAIYEHFLTHDDPYFGLVVPVDMTLCYQNAKENKVSFFTTYLFKFMQAVNATQALRLRIIDNKVYDTKTVDCSTTIFKTNKAFGLSYIEFEDDYQSFHKKFIQEQERIENSDQFFPDKEASMHCIHCSALPWIKFIGHKEPRSGKQESIPKFGFSKTYQENGKLLMNISIDIHHGLVDGYHVNEFFEHFQNFLDN